MSSKRAKPTEADKAAAARLKAAWDARDPKMGLTQDRMAEHLGITQGAVSQYLNGLIPLNFRALQGFAATLGIDPLTIRSDLPEQRHLVSGAEPRITANETATDYVRAIDMGAEGGMGDGRINDDFPEVIRAVDYTQQYIRGLVGFVPPPGRLVLFTGRGDSMMPTIQPGESLLVDTGVTSFDRDGIYLVNLGHGQQIKRLVDHGEEAGVHVHSDNPAYPTIRWPKGGVIGGKVYLRNRTDRLD